MEIHQLTLHVHDIKSALDDTYSSTCRQSEDIDTSPISWELVVTIGKDHYPINTMWDEGGCFVVELENGQTMELSTDWCVGEPMMLANINGKDVSVQVLI